MKLENFGPFEGIQTINFSNDIKKPITIIHANNGTGKTTLLNAFLWVLFGTYHEQKNEIPNHFAVSQTKVNDKVDISVEIKFIHDNNKYTVKRNGSFKKIDEITVELINREGLFIAFIDKDGKSCEPSNPGNYIDQNILPFALKEYFFFHGEKIEALTLPRNVSSAIKNIMGITLLERAEKHLKKASKKFSKMIDEKSEGKLKEVINKINKLDSKIADLKNRIENNKETLSINKEQIDAIGDQLRTNELTEEIQLALDELNRQKENNNSKRQNIIEKSKQLINNSAYLMLVSNFIQENKDFLDQKRIKGEIPGKVRKVLIDDILELGVCICGESIGQKQRIKLLEDSKTAISPEFENRVAVLNNQLSSMLEKSKAISSILKDNTTNLVELREELKLLDGKISDTESKLDGKGFETVENLKNKRIELRVENDDFLVENTRLEVSIKNITTGELHDLNLERDQLIKLDSQQELFKFREEIAKDAANFYSELLSKINDKVRKELTKIFSDTYNGIMIADYEVKINDAFQLEIRKKTDGRKPVESDGQKRVKSLSFVGALISLGEKYSNNNNKYLRGGIFPLVVDSPFGELDPNYQSLISRNIASLADQVILFVSPSQWTSAVENELGNFVGKHIYLKYHTTKSEKEYKVLNNNIKLIGEIEFGAIREKTIIIEQNS